MKLRKKRRQNSEENEREGMYFCRKEQKKKGVNLQSSLREGVKKKPRILHIVGELQLFWNFF